jgi:hypothetical protein
VPAQSAPRHPRPLAEVVFQDVFGHGWDEAREFPFRASVSPTPEI